MTSRKRLRQLFTGKSMQGDESQVTGSDRSAGSAAGDHDRLAQSGTGNSSRKSRNPLSRVRKRQHLLETLESRQMLAGPQLIGIQPNEGDVIVEGSIRNVAPRTLTLRFDEVQQIDPSTFGSIRITRGGADQIIGNADDVVVQPGLITLGAIKQNEVIVRFAETLPDDKYQIAISAFDDTDRGIVALRNLDGEVIRPSTIGARTERVNFELNLGALVEAVVPQPVVRLANGTLEQRRDELLVYFNEDPLFVENDPATGAPTARSAENPRFYQLLLTQDTVRNTDDLIYFPERVIYDQATHTARLIFFGNDINLLPGVPLSGGTFRLRVGSAVDTSRPSTAAELILPPMPFAIAPSVSSSLRTVTDLSVKFTSKIIGETSSGPTVRFINTGTAGLSATALNGNVTFNFGGATALVSRLVSVAANTPAVDAVLSVSFSRAGVPNVGGELVIRAVDLVGAPPLVMTAVGDTITTALDVGIFGRVGQPATSFTLSQSIDAQPFLIELPGGNDDPGRLQIPESAGAGLLQTINANFGPDTTSGITEIAYNFQSVFESSGGVSQLNQITEPQKLRVREALQLWSRYLGVEFRETANQGITFARGATGTLLGRPNTQLTSQPVLNAALRIDPTFVNSAMVLSNQTSFGNSYGEDFFRKTMAGIGFLLGLEQTTDRTAQTLMSLNAAFLDAAPNTTTSPNFLGDLEPAFPGAYDILHGRYLHRTDSIDVDMYRFEVNLGPGERTGSLTAETFAERLTDSSLLDTTLTLFQEVNASVTTNFKVNVPLAVKFTSVQPGALGNSAKIQFNRTSATSITIQRSVDASGVNTTNGIVIDVPQGRLVTAGEIIDAVNRHPVAGTLFTAELQEGLRATVLTDVELSFSPLSLSGGGIVQLSRNDDYFSEDSQIKASLANGVYYIGVAASGNDTYDPTIPNSGFGGTTQGLYELQLKFEPQVNETDTIRDRDTIRVGVPGTAIDGDGDGVPGGVNNFWFQTRPLNRTLNVTSNGAAIVPRQTFSVTAANGVKRTFEFVPQVGGDPGVPTPGNIAIGYNPGVSGGGGGSSTPAGNIAATIRTEISRAFPATSTQPGVQATAAGSVVALTGERSFELSTNFRGIDVLGRTLFVDKTAGVNADGSQDRPFNNIANSNVPNAFGAARTNDIVRIVGNGGVDKNPNTLADNFSYKIGTTETGGFTLEDGRNMNVPQGVTVMIDAGAAFKLRNSVISVGSTNLLGDRSQGALQVLGTPRLVTLTDPDNLTNPRGIALSGNDGDVIFTSTRDRSVDRVASGNSSAPTPGNWGGLIYRRDIDKSVGRSDLEDEGIFLQTVNHADIRFGGSSNILIDSNQQLVNPIQIFNLRPTITFNEITFSADAAISASPDSFEETSYQTPQFQQAGAFTADYSRVGPAINNNFIVNNSINGLFVRVVTTPDTPPRALTVTGRFDDIDIVHYIAENILIAGTPGGSIQDGVRPDVSTTVFVPQSGGTLTAGSYNYILTLVDRSGFESLASVPSSSVTVSNNSSIRLINLPPVQANTDYTGRRLYRRGPVGGVYRLVTQLDMTSTTFFDNGRTTQGVLDLSRVGIRGRLDASLVIDPGTVVKFRGARLELGQGTQLLAEGLQSNPVIFTSYADDRFGAGGTFDTNNDTNSLAGIVVPARGDWSGIYAAPTSRVSFDHASIAYGGGVSLIDGGQSRGFAALELQQADARVTNSRFEFNEDGQDGAGPVGRIGRLGVTPSTIFVRGSQPIIVGNQFVDNRGSIIDIDSDSMTADRLVDTGRQTGDVDRFAQLDDNYGPLIRLNRYENVAATAVANRQISGLEIRGGVLATESVWDDTDIVHMLFDSITVGNIHSVGGLRLMSRNDESLVVKLTGAGSPFSATSGTGITATGSLSNIEDRIGGSVQIIGKPGAPVVLTSFLDDTVGAGVRPDGTAFTDTNGDSFGSRPEGNDWRSILLDTFSNDRNFDYILEQTIAAENSPGLNGTIANAQVLGILAPNQLSSDELLRLGFEVEGFLPETIDIDHYNFIAQAGTRVWLDVDRTSFGLDTVVEILDGDGNVLARSDNSFAEVAGTPLTVLDPNLQTNVRNLQGGNAANARLGAGGLYEDYGSTNPRDAGLNLTLPGSVGVESVYFVRVRSASINPDDAQGGLTKGGYRFQVRLQEQQEFVGSIVRFADIRYANHGIHVRGLNGDSPLLGEAQENEGVSSISSNNTISGAVPGNRAQYLGNLTSSENKVFSVGGSLVTANDIDFYQIDVLDASVNQYTSMIFDIDFADGFNRPDTTLYVFYDEDGENDPIPARLILAGENSNVLDDLAKPVSSMPIDLLSRGSVSSGDPLIGPIALSRGTYYVAVVGNGTFASALSGVNTKREPIESILRIFEDHVEAIGGSTALAPREGMLFNPATFSTGWTVTTNRASDPGHQLTQTFNDSRSVSAFPTSDQFENGALGDTFATAQDLDLGDPLWSLAADQNIGSTTTNTSQFIPHTTVQGLMVNDVVDIYQFTVPASGGLVILDIDNGFNPQTTGLNPVTDPTSVNLKLQLFNAAFGLLASNSLSPFTNGALGSQRNSTFSSISEDPFIQTFLPGGTYFIAVSPEASTYDAVTTTFSLDPLLRPATGTYELNVSVQNHPDDGSNAGNQSIFFDRSAPSGTITSATFDLTGYSANDLPRFYFNYFYSPGGTDSVSIRARSAQNPAGSTLIDAILQPTTVFDNVWSQAVASLAPFAGHTGIVLEFIYNTDTTSPAGEGLYLDDFIVGFAERGELITNAPLGETGMTGFSSTSAGEYQLEVRPATSYGTSLANSLLLTSTFDTNARQSDSVTIVAPHASQLADGNTFTLSDGIRTVRFEFDSLTSSGVVAGNVRVPFTSTSTRTQIADAIRTAINSSVVQSTLQLQASDSSGSATGGSRDVKVEIIGSVFGDFLELASPAALPPSGGPLDSDPTSFRLPVVFNRGVGDLNAVRAQSQIIIDSNKISHVHAIGIYSEPEFRGIDPEDQPDVFLDRSPVGPSYPGAVRNLPTLNNEVVGGQTPGIAIRNNTIDRAGMAGIKVEGELRPYVIDSPFYSAAITTTFGDLIHDGLTMIVDAADVRVIFEFEDISGDVPQDGGSGVVAGNGFVDGHVPIYYRRTSPAIYLGRNTAYTRHEVMRAIYDAINSSILVANGLAPLVKATLGSSLEGANESPNFGFFGFFGLLNVSNASVYVEGATNIEFSSLFRTAVALGSPFDPVLASVYEPPQPVPRIVNNTIFGEDGSAGRFPETALTSEPNDLLVDAVDTRLGAAHTGAYIQSATLGDAPSIISTSGDVDFYRVFLGAGDRLVVDVDTLAGSGLIPEGPNTLLRLFDANGVQVSVNDSAVAPDFLETAAAAGRDSANPRALDPFIDFTARREGVYYVGVSFAGNESYDPQTISGRPVFTATQGAYQIAMEVYAPRSFVLSIDNLNGGFAGNTGTVGSSLIGTTFTATQIPNLLSGGLYPIRTTNQQVFRFVDGGGGVLFNGATGEIEIGVNGAMRVPDIVATIALAMNRDPFQQGLLALGNHSDENGPDGLSGPLEPGDAFALGGSDAGIVGLRTFPVTGDFNTPYGHNRATTGFGVGVSELYALIDGIAEITISPTAAAAGLRMDPVAGLNIDQLYPETGILLTGGVSGTVLNNVLSNLHQGVVNEVTSFSAFPNGTPDIHPKPGAAIVTANVFQHVVNANNVFRTNMNSPFGAVGITAGPSNVNGGSDDFNLTFSNTAPLFVFAEAGNFLPSEDSRIIDSSVNSLIERSSVADLRRSVGLPISNVLAPNRDVNGMLRADNPNVAPPGGLGSQVFKDRGSNELADFVGPVAILDFPRDNDPVGIDVDQATSFLRLRSGVYNEFRIQLRDTGDSSDPFAGLGIDDNTVVVPSIEDLRSPGANITLFEGDRLLAEGINYTFSYDSTRNVIALTPIAGIWRNDRAYRVLLNNRDRFVGIAPAAGQIIDGDSFTVTDSQGGRVNFEYDSGYQLVVPEVLQFTVPDSGTGVAGISDGDLFRLTGTTGQTITFEFNRDNTQLTSTREVRYFATDTPEMVAAAARAAIAAAATAGLIDVSVNTAATGATVVIGSNVGTVLDASNSGLVIAARTIALQVPTAGQGPAGVNDGDVLTINDGSTTVSFEFEIVGGLNNPSNTPISITGSGNGVLSAIQNAISISVLKLRTVGIGNNLFLGLPINGFATVSGGQLKPVGISRTPADGDTITLTPASGTAVTLELTSDATIIPGNVRVDFSRSDTGDQLASKIAIALQSQSISELDEGAVQANPGGQISVGGTAGLLLALNAGLPITRVPTIVATGAPDVAGSTLLTISGPLLIQIPIAGGGGVPDDSQFTLSNGVASITFIYNLVNTGIASTTATPIAYQTFQDADTVALATVTAINAAVGLNITATNQGNGVISLGAIGDNQLSFPALPAISAPLTPRRGIVTDGERITITQAGQALVFEFQSAIGGGSVTANAIPIVFQTNGTVTDIANILAASINNNRGNLNLTATVEPGGRVRLADTPTTTTNVSLAPTITLSGEPGGAVAVSFTGSFTAEDIKRSIIDAVNDASASGKTTLTAENRGGSTFFIENASLIGDTLTSYYLGGIKDIAGNLLEPTRDDNSTQFTMLLPTVGLDYGDAPDPVSGVRGRYPTRLDVDGARHVVGDEVRLGTLIDIEGDGQPNTMASGDNANILISMASPVFVATIANGVAEIGFNLPTNISSADGSTITVSTGIDVAIFEFDTDGIFDENHFAVSVSPTGTVSLATIAQAFVDAVRESNLRPADVLVAGNRARIITDDEDGVSFTSEFNPTGIFNPGVPTPIQVTVTGGGVLEAWIDFNADGDFTDPGEQIIDRSNPFAIFPKTVFNTPLTRTFIINVPTTTPGVNAATATYARFRVSTEGGLAPTGLALSGEVEDYRVTLLPGLPPTVNATNRTLTYSVDEDAVLQAIDADGSLTPGSANDNGTVAGISDPDGDNVEVFVDDIGTRTLLDPSGATAGELTLFDDGTFTFVPANNFFGNTQFTFRVTDVPLADPLRQLVSPIPITVNLTIRPVNDRPFVTNAAPNTTRNIAEDSVVTFTTAELTRFYSPGPANESTQTLLIQSAGVSGFGFQTARGGILSIVNGNLQYTPPVNAGGQDTFTYVVADDPNDINQLVQSATTRGTVTINISLVNDAPFVGTDSFGTAEDTPLVIDVRGPTGILANDIAGPPDEVTAGQTLSLVTSDFPKLTDRGGTIALGSGNTTLIYTPPLNFDGRDQFTYRVSDTGTPSATGTGTVVINVGGDNDAPVFVGVNGIVGRTTLTLNESKETEQVLDFNLSSWFTDPEGDATTFVVTPSDANILTSEVILDGATQVSTLRLRLRSFKSGSLQLNIVATNGTTGPSSSVVVPVTVLNTPDPPIIIGALNPLNAVEDETVVRDLATVFSDPDGGQLTYTVTRFGTLLNPTAAQIAASPLVNSITFSGSSMTITLDQDASGSVDIQIAASDGTFQVSDTFTLAVTPVPDTPRGTADFYNVPIGAKFEIIDPSQGLNGNDSDPDLDVFAGTARKVRVDLTSVTQPTNGTVTVNVDGTFAYTNNRGATGGTDTFTYRPIDPTGLVGSVVTVTFNLGRSRYQNPIPGFNFDVTANGVISALDALRIINLLSRQGSNSVPVSSLTTAPPDFFDVNGSGTVTALDALLVINEISRRNRSLLGSGEGESQAARLATTVAYAAPTTIGLKESNVVATLTPPPAKIKESEPYDPFAAGFDVVDRRVEQSADDLQQLAQPSKSTENTKMAVDEVLSSWFEQSIL